MTKEARTKLLDLLWDCYNHRRQPPAAVIDAEHILAAAVEAAMNSRDAAIRRVMNICESLEEPLEWRKDIMDTLGGCFADSETALADTLGLLEALAKRTKKEMHLSNVLVSWVSTLEGGHFLYKTQKDNRLVFIHRDEAEAKEKGE